MIDFVQVGLKISYYRRKINLSQEELANKLYVTRQAVSKWENGTSIPSIDTLLSLSELFTVSFEEILCLNDTNLKLDLDDIFQGHDRNYIINKIISNEANVNIPDIFYQLSPRERLIVLRAIKEGKTICDVEELYVKLTISEQKFLGGDNYEVKKSSY